ncbi:MAG: hypothetical protein JWP27_1948 [Flaviaesturariibacter sp.]|nr:hypothetical protein [Flaviaesturariibacter sp.]
MRDRRFAPGSPAMETSSPGRYWRFLTVSDPVAGARFIVPASRSPQFLFPKNIIMKKLAFLLLLLTLGICVGAQTLDTVTVVSRVKKFKSSEHFLLTYEVIDTVDANGMKITMSRCFYFDKRNRTISSVRENFNSRKPKRGTEVIYSFGANKLASVTVRPPKSVCRDCTTRYLYANDSLIGMQGTPYSTVNSAIFLKQAHYFQSRLPHDLPWGFFDDEVLINGARKKSKID